MGFRVSLNFTLLAMLCDLALLSGRVAFRSDSVTGYVLLALHEAVLLALALLLASFILYTRWLIVSAFRDVLWLLRVVGPLWLVRVALTFLPSLYKEVILPYHRTESTPRAWTDAGYGVLFCLNVVVFLFFNVALLHTICFVSNATPHTSRYSACQSQRLSAVTNNKGNPLEWRAVDDASLSLGEATV